MDLTSMLVYGADRYPDALALRQNDLSLSYIEWSERVLRLAAGLRELGVSAGDRVALGMRNSIDHATALFATQAAGAVAVPFNFRIKQDGAAHVMADSGAAVLVTDGAVAPAIADAVAASQGARWVNAGTGGGLPFADLLTSPPIDFEPAPPEALSTILYTSGTTGRPKGVPVTHRNAYERIVSYVASAGPGFASGMRTLGAPPLYHTVGLHWVLCLTVYLNGAYFPVQENTRQNMSDVILRNELTFLFGSPTLFHILLEGADPELVYPSVEEVSFGSAPMDAGLLGRMRHAFPNATISEVFGTTETSIPFVTRDVTRWPLGALRITADHRVRIVDPASVDDTPVADGEVGELLVDMRNEASFSGYWRAEDKTASAVRNGWYHTGDAFSRDRDGNYYIHGRLDDMFISGGENIQPLEVEQVLLSHPQIEDAAVVGTPDPLWGKVVTAFISVTGDTGAVDVDAFCRASSLDDFKRPRRVVFVPAIPRNPSGKIVRAELHALYEQMQGDPSDGNLAAQRN